MKTKSPAKTSLELWIENNNYGLDVVEICDAHSVTPEDVEKYFARTYWDKPRETNRLYPMVKVKGVPVLVDGYFFEVMNGTTIYQIMFIPGIHLVSNSVYHVVRYSKKTKELE